MQFTPRFLCLLTLGLASACDGPSIDEALVVNGEDIAIDQAPWTVALARKLEIDELWAAHYCGATNIGKGLILTAAHCLDEITDAQDLVVLYDHDTFDGITSGYEDPSFPYVAPYLRSEAATWSEVIEIIVHPDHDPITEENDLAVLVTASPPLLGPEFTIAIADESPPADTEVLVQGWGRTENGPTTVLQQANVLIWPDDEASDYFSGDREYKSATMIAAGANRRDTCQGDSGGPLVIPAPADDPESAPLLVGITSWGGECGEGGVYTRVSTYYDWIESIVEAQDATDAEDESIRDCLSDGRC